MKEYVLVLERHFKGQKVTTLQFTKQPFTNPERKFKSIIKELKEANVQYCIVDSKIIHHVNNEDCDFVVRFIIEKQAV